MYISLLEREFLVLGLNSKSLYLIDLRVIPVILLLMIASLFVISSSEISENNSEFFSPRVISQVRWFVLGFGFYFFFTCLDYHFLRQWAWVFYGIALLALVGLFFTEGSKNVHRWYRLPFMHFQPSELAKLILVITLATFLERNKNSLEGAGTLLQSAVIVGIPFLLIFKQPDLGTALLLFPITLVMFYFGGMRKNVVRLMTIGGALLLFIVLLFFLRVIPHDEFRHVATYVMKEYQYERLNPDTHHQKAAITAISVGGLTGTGWKESEFTRRGWLPEAQTDSVFPAFVEEFGFLGAFALVALFYALIYFSFQVSAVAKDEFGCLLSAGITAYLSMHVIVNIAMMSGLLPITGVPLILVSYGGSSVLVTMSALGILQSIYSRRYMFSW